MESPPTSAAWKRLWTLDRGLAPAHDAVLWRSYDGARLYAATVDRELHLVTLDAHSGDIVRDERLEITFFGRDHGPATLGASSSNGDHIALGTRSGVVLLVTRGAPSRYWFNGGTIDRLEFSQRGAMLLAAARKQPVRVWDCDRLDVASANVGGLPGASLSPDGTRLVYIDAANPLRVCVGTLSVGVRPGFDGSGLAQERLALALQSITEVYAHHAPLDSVVFDADGERLWAKAPDGSVLHISARIARCVQVAADAELCASARAGEVFVRGPEGVQVVRADGPEALLAPAPHGKHGRLRVDPRGALWSARGVLKWRDRDADAPKEFESAHEGGARAVAFSPDGAQLATVGDDRRVRLWRTEDSAPLWTFEGHREPIGAVGFAPDGRTLYSAGVSGELKAWDLSSGHERDTLAVRELSGVVPFEAMRLSPDGTRLALRAGTPRQVREVDLLRWAERAHPSLDLACWELAYDPEGALVMIARPSWQSEVLRVAPSGEVLSSVVLGLPVENGWTAPKLTYRALALLGPEARTMALSRDARTGHFVVGRVDRASKLLSVRFDGAVCVERAALGRRRVAAGTRGRLWCWELRETFCGWSPAQREAAWSAELPQRDAVTALALSPDERTLVATTDRGAVFAWRIEAP